MKIFQIMICLTEKLLTFNTLFQSNEQKKAVKIITKH